MLSYRSGGAERVGDSGEAVSDSPSGGLDPRFDAEFAEDVVTWLPRYAE